MKVAYFNRKCTKIHFSIELLFKAIKDGLDRSIISLVWTSPWYSEGLIPRIKMIWNAAKFNSDINHITGDIHFIALGLPSKNTILTIHDLGFMTGERNAVSRWVLKVFWITLPVWRVAMVTVVSDATKKHLLELVKVKEDKIRIIGNFISDAFHKNPKVFNEKKPNILQIGSAANKNLDRIILALKGVNCHLTIVGYPNDHQIECLILNNIAFTVQNGVSDEEMILMYQNSDLLVFASLLEGFGLPILEAQSIGRPVITSNISSMPEVAGDAACFVDPYSVDSIRSGILRIMEDKHYREFLISKGFENINRFKKENIVKQYEELYFEVYKGS